jgi:hypothetical protein
LGCRTVAATGASEGMQQEAAEMIDTGLRATTAAAEEG